jgi:hypothetical protein
VELAAREFPEPAQEIHLDVEIVARQDPACVEVVSDLAAELEVQLVAELLAALDD